MTKQEHTEAVERLQAQIKTLHKKIEQVDERYFQSVLATLAERGIERLSPITIYGQPCYFVGIVRRDGQIVVKVRSEMKRGGMANNCRHAAIRDIDDIILRNTHHHAASHTYDLNKSDSD